MDRPKSILKVMKALKDAKTWTSDAKRQAKRKREEARTTNEADAKKQDIGQVKQELVISEVPEAIGGEPVKAMLDETALAANNGSDNANEQEKPKADGFVPTSASFLEKRGQTLPLQKQKKKDAPAQGEAYIAPPNETDTEVHDAPLTLKLEDVVMQDEGMKQVPEDLGHQIFKEESSELVEHEQEALAAAAAAAAASLETAGEGELLTGDDTHLELPGGEQATCEQSSQAVLQGLQLLTKAAANARDTSDKPMTYDV